MPEWEQGPYRWADFGAGHSWMLVTQHGGAKVILSARHGHLETRDPTTGRLVRLTPEHPVGRLLEAAPALYDALTAILAHGSVLSVIEDHEREAAQRALAQANGREPRDA